MSLVQGRDVRVGLNAPAVALRLSLDAAILLTIGATFEGLADPDVLFHVVWVLLVVHAFTSPTLSPVITRIVLSTICLVAYWFVPLMVGKSVLDFAEWPLMVFMLVIVTVMAHRHRQNTRRVLDLYRMASDRLVTVQESARKRVGQDLHDGVGQSLSSLALVLESAGLDLTVDHPSARNVATARELAALATEEIRSVTDGLVPPLLRRGLAPSIHEIAAHSGMSIRTEIYGLAGAALQELQPEVQLQIFRIVQEAVANIVKHSGASSAAIRIEQLASSIELTVSDDGRGFSVAESEGHGLGLSGMQYRAHSIGARVSVTSLAGHGSIVQVVIPVPNIPQIGSDRRVVQTATQ